MASYYRYRANCSILAKELTPHIIDKELTFIDLNGANCS
jgi:hypothetical protein